MDEILGQLERTPSGCWEFMGRRDKDGYGCIGHKRTHREVFAAFCAPLTPGLVVCHSCDNPPCCNPVHLSGGTNASNTAERDARGRGPRGAKNGRATVTVEMVHCIRQLRLQGHSQKATARLVGTTRAVVQNIDLKRAWAHV